MNFKKFLCSILAVAMLMSTMGVFVLAEGELPSDAITINGTAYGSLEEALDKAQNGDTIILNSPNVAIDAKGVTQ